MDIFLRAKHWQLFLATFGLAFLFQAIIMFNLFSNVLNNNNPTTAFNDMKFFPLMMLLFMGVLFGWFWSIAIGLQKMVPSGIKMKVGKFKIFFFIPLVYMLLLLVFMSFIFTTYFPSNEFLYTFAFPFLIIIPLHLFSMFCIFYCLYFVAKTLKTVELQREVGFSDFAGEFFLAWFYPIGIWILQPKINRMLEKNTNNHQVIQ